MISINARKITEVKKRLTAKHQPGSRIHQQQHDDDEEGSYPSQEERTIGCARSAEAFIAWTESRKDVKCDLIDGNIVIRELPGVAHGYCAADFIAQMKAQGLRATTPVDVVSRVNALDIREPDALVSLRGQSNTPGGNVPGAPSYLAIVFEVACKQRPLDLHTRATWFLGPAVPCVQYYIGVKIYNQRQDNSIAMAMALYTRANGGARPVEVISFGDVPLWHNCFFSQFLGDPSVHFRGLGFGDPPCAVAGMPSYIVNLDTAYLYSTNTLGVPAGAPPEYRIDLFHHRDGILEERSANY